MPATLPSTRSTWARPSRRSRQLRTTCARTGRRLLTIGGDHTIALPLLRSLARDHGKIAVLHFDAHLDTWDTYFGAPYTHGTPFRRASEEGLLDLERCLHMGTRGPLYSSQDLEDDHLLGFQVIRSDDYQSDGVASIVDRMRARLGDAPGLCLHRHRRPRPGPRPRHRHPGSRRPDQSGTAQHAARPGRPEHHRRRHRRGLPPYDHAEITGIAAAHVAYELLSVLACNRRNTDADAASAQASTPPTPVTHAQKALT